MFNVNVVVLSYDQMQFSDNNRLSVFYWTIVGGYLSSMAASTTREHAGGCVGLRREPPAAFARTPASSGQLAAGGLERHPARPAPAARAARPHPAAAQLRKTFRLRVKRLPPASSTPPDPALRRRRLHRHSAVVRRSIAAVRRGDLPPSCRLVRGASGCRPGS